MDNHPVEFTDTFTAGGSLIPVLVIGAIALFMGAVWLYMRLTRTK